MQITKKGELSPFLCFHVLYKLLIFLPAKRPTIKLITNNTRKMKNKIFAMLAAPAAIPVKPNKAATNAITKNITAYLNIIISLKLYLY